MVETEISVIAIVGVFVCRESRNHHLLSRIEGKNPGKDDRCPGNQSGFLLPSFSAYLLLLSHSRLVEIFPTDSLPSHSVFSRW